MGKLNTVLLKVRYSDPQMVSGTKKVKINLIVNRLWWPSGLRRRAISQLILATEVPEFESPLGITILIVQK